MRRKRNLFDRIVATANIHHRFVEMIVLILSITIAVFSHGCVRISDDHAEHVKATSNFVFQSEEVSVDKSQWAFELFFCDDHELHGQ